jgi:hypothetical protein
MTTCNESSSHFIVIGTRRSAILAFLAFYIFCNLVASFNSVKSFSSGLLQEVQESGKEPIVLSRRKNTIAEIDDSIDNEQEQSALTMLLDDDSIQQDSIDPTIRQDQSTISNTSVAPLHLVICATVR